MAKQPYIPLYIGDWEQDTNCITAMAEFALLKLTFKLFKAEKKGVFCTNLRSLTLLFKSNQQESKDILNELIENNILEIDIKSDTEICIKSRRMMREATISDERSEVGKKGAQAKRKQNASKKNKKENFASTEQQAKPQQNTDIDNDNVIDSDIKTCNAKEHEILVVFHRWLKYKKDRKENYKSTDSMHTAFEKLKRFCKGDPLIAFQIIDDAIGNNYAGFFEPKANVKPPSSQTQSKVGIAVESSTGFMDRFNQQQNGSR